ncbi:MAG: glycosyl transferase family protein, partial [Phycisphaerales bacterium]|nr:glycosyl transferase family protein [Phycisphaerales bacterium]
ELIDALDAAGVPVIFSFHDFYAACPTIQLLDEEGTFCGGRCTEGPGDCPVVPNFFRGSLPVLKHRHVHNHRRRMEEALRKCRAFVAPSNATREVVTDSFPFLRDGQPDSEVGFRVVEHGRDLLPRRRLAVAPQPGRPARVICLGNIDRAKGADLIRRVMELDRDNPGGPRFEFHFLGNHAPSFRVERLGAVNHGPYRREDLPSLVESIAPSFAMIASIWPETFCYTLSEAWALGLPVFASDIGTLRERVDACAGGWLLDHADPERWYEGMVRALEDSDGYPRRVRAVAAAPLRFVADMAEDYLELYQALLGEKRWAGRVRPAPAVEASPAVNLSSMK